MSEYTDAAPLLSKGVTVTKFKADNPKPVAPVPVPDEEPTKAKVTEVYNLLLTLEAQGIGYSGVARMTKVSKRWVKQIHAEMSKAKGVVYAPVVEPV